MAKPKGTRGGTIYVLEKEYAGTVLEVGASQGGGMVKQEVVISLQHGNLRLSGLTLDEARACGAHLYRPAIIRVQVKLDDGIQPEQAAGKGDDR